MRGEYRSSLAIARVTMELPPRARRIRLTGSFTGLNAGTTSACAENTGTNDATCFSDRNYLRVRGEYNFLHARLTTLGELPPRARRIHTINRDVRIITGTISACAENT